MRAGVKDSVVTEHPRTVNKRYYAFFADLENSYVYSTLEMRKFFLQNLGTGCHG